MPEFDPPECDEGHEAARMSFLESYDPLDDEDSSEWRERWRYACPECGRVVEVKEAAGEGFEERTIREDEDARSDPTSLSPVAEWD